jgi:hypothetical protein
LAAGPHCRVKVSDMRRIGSAGRRPTIGAGIISPAGIQSGNTVKSAPDDHFAAGPYCCESGSPSGRVIGAGWRPTIGARNVPTTAIETAETVSAAPDDHFGARPHCRVIPSASGRVCRARWSPGIINATTRGIGYNRKMIGAVHLNLGD